MTRTSGNYWCGSFSISLEGCYALELSVNKSQNRGRVKCVFSIKQRVIDKSTGDYFLPIMTKIANFFWIVKSILNQQITFLAQADSKHNWITSYFDK